ncbi:MAG: sulfite oxidase-like oxidoreductase [Deltaproteobacteria bacterium]|nr:sulfite oxidase-like oxidoreductase [Kofleriaceae bacterium]
MADDDDKLARIVEARMKLRERWKDRMHATPSLADGEPMGTGPTNRHGMPQLPPDQYETKKWPVLDLGVKPEIPTSRWSLAVDGAVKKPVTLAWNDLLALEQLEDTSDFHCVTKWSKMNMRWRGVRLGDVLALAEPDDDAHFLMCHGHDGYTVNLPLEEALKPDVLLAHTVDGAPLAVEHGGPCRVITPQLYAWKGAKWVTRIELMREDKLGFWEERGYSNTAYPWRNDRYS